MIILFYIALILVLYWLIKETTFFRIRLPYGKKPVDFVVNELFATGLRAVMAISIILDCINHDDETEREYLIRTIKHMLEWRMVDLIITQFVTDYDNTNTVETK